MNDSRRAFFWQSCVAKSAGLLCASGRVHAAEEGTVLSGPSPSEYLMRQHGIVHRLALLFETVAERAQEGKRIEPAFLQTRGLVHDFTEDYHEELEENYIFPLFTGGGPLEEMVSVLRMQHSMGHTLAQRAYRIAEKGPDLDEDERRKLASGCRSYSRMYRAHAAFEDTQMWPALRETVSPSKYEDITEAFARMAEERLGDEGFSGAVEQMAEIEQKLGIDGLSDFTPGELP